jgi:hypothetical protein
VEISLGSSICSAHCQASLSCGTLPGILDLGLTLYERTDIETTSQFTNHNNNLDGIMIVNITFFSKASVLII